MNFGYPRIKLVALCIAILIFVIFGFCVSDWWFHTADDFSAVIYGFYGSKSFSAIVKSCFLKDINYYMDLNQCSHNLNFWQTFFRPFCCFFYVISYKIFGVNAYCYFFLNILIHSINVYLITLLLLLILNGFWAILLGLFFAVHPLIGYLIGPISYFQHYFVVMLLLICFFFYNRYILTGHFVFYLIAVMLFSVNVFFRESCLYIPIVVFWGTFLFARKSVTEILLLTSGFVGVAFSYLLTKAAICSVKLPIISSQVGIISFLIKKMELKFFDFIKIMKDLYWVSWVPDNCRVLNGGIVLLGVGFLICAIIKNQERSKIIFCFAGMIFALWPLIVMNYYSRYIYEMLPFWILAIAFLLKPYQDYMLRHKKVVLILGILCIGLLTLLSINNLRIRSHNSQILKGAVLNLVKNLHSINPQNKPLCFVGLPYNGFVSGIEHAIKLFVVGKTPEVIFDPTTVIIQPNEHLVRRNLFFKESSPLPTLNFYQVEKTEKFLFLKVSDLCKISFYGVDKKNTYRDGNGRVIGVKLWFDGKKISKETIFLKFDYEKKLFVLV